MKLTTLILVIVIAAFGSACQSTQSSSAARSYVPDIAVTHAPYTNLTANWKQRLDQPYVFFENRGDYRLAGQRFGDLTASLEAQGFGPSGPPFMLFYDDPAEVPLDELRSRVCLPVSGPVSASGNLRYEVLPSTTVVYAVVAGPYPDAPRAYPGLFRYLNSMHWIENGPVREVYLVRPDATGDFDQLLCEIQIPATQQR